MNNYELFEIGVILLIIILQIRSFVKTRQSIEQLSQLFPDVSSFRIKKVYFSKRDLQDLNSQDLLKQIEEKLPEKTPAESSAKNEGIATQTTAEVSDIPSIEYFISAPNQDGSFNESDITSKYKRSITLYRIILFDPDNGDYELIDNLDVRKRVLQEPDRLLVPVCEYGNAYDSSAKGIKTIRRGKILRDDNIWKVVSKSIIEFKW